MDRLPQELLDLIAEVVNYEDLEPLRLVNKAFAAAAAPSLFEVIPLWIGNRSLERLTAISKHPQLSQYPKEIFFSPLRFIGYDNDTFYEDKAKVWLEDQPASPSTHACTLGEHMSAYRSYIEAQQLLSSNDLDVKILSRAFSLLSRVQVLHVDYDDTYIGSTELIHAFGTFRARDLLTCSGHHTLPVLLQALAASSLKVKVFELGSDITYTYSSTDCRVGNYSKGASLQRPQQSISEADFSYPDGISILALSRTFCAENFDMCNNAFSGLRKLHVGGIRVTQDDDATLSRIAAALRSLMQCALCIESVTLEEIWLYHHLEAVPQPTMSSVLPHGFNNIKQLDVQYYETTAEFLCDFFGRHRTIVKVDFYSVTITGSNWSTALKQLRTLDLVLLEVFILSFHDSAGHDVQVQDYILKRTDKDPLVEERKQSE
ncbi:hypothetical protein IMSHALPRED_006392 [Imshaugia aleurites]|uniref:F-box domain-containing protein n=1 Tax=Imshaugia aleurites TaxID=172621 RepID=A0A8H3FLR0_9LECA|nr:hypothetical protein IMSHALPRED_006392 [Imshaugia aleurites]